MNVYGIVHAVLFQYLHLWINFFNNNTWNYTAFQITVTFLFLARFQKFKNWIEAQLLLYLPIIIPTRFFLKYPKKGVGGRGEPRTFFPCLTWAVTSWGHGKCNSYRFWRTINVHKIFVTVILMRYALKVFNYSALECVDTEVCVNFEDV